MVEIVKQAIPDAVVTAVKLVLGRQLMGKELRLLNDAGIEVSAPQVDYAGFMLEAEYTYYFQAVRSCV